MAKILRAKDIAGLAAEVIAGAGRLVAPTPIDGEHRLAVIDSAGRFSLPSVNTVNSIKEFFFPQCDQILSFSRSGAKVALTTPTAAEKPFVVFGVRPCDAASLAIMDKVMNWDTVDEGWKRRRDAATVVTFACRASDEYCFCASVGLSPDSRSGADVIMVPVKGGNYSVEALTDKGRAFVDAHSRFFPEGETGGAEVAAVARRFDAGEVRNWLAGSFDSELWTAASERCLGCGVCTYFCPTCHCFDIQDEADAGRGARFKTWDSCSFGLFTKHTSGHNPRPDRPSRWRQRILHKFYYYPERFGVISCTGCGRCGRHCPVDLGVEETMRAVPREAR